MPWWGWLVLGLGLLGAEMFLIDAEFYLVFVGISAVLVGLAGMAGVAGPAWVQWLVFALLAVLTMVAFRRRIYELVRGRAGEVLQRVTSGDRVVVVTRLEPGAECRVDYRGTSWTARNVATQPIDAGTEAEIVTVNELTLHIRPPAAS